MNNNQQDKYAKELERVQKAIDEFQDYIISTIGMMEDKHPKASRSNNAYIKKVPNPDIANFESMRDKLFQLNTALTQGNYAKADDIMKSIQKNTNQKMYRALIPNVRNSMILCTRTLLHVVDNIQYMFTGQYYGDKVKTPGAKQHKLFDKPITSLKSGVTRLETELGILKSAIEENKNRPAGSP